MKISTNSELALRKKHWIDFDVGSLLQERTMGELNDELWSAILSVASGDTTTKNENNGYREIAIFKRSNPVNIQLRIDTIPNNER